jgi:hypothetical protein
MKHLVLFGPGTSPTVLVNDDQANDIKEKFLRGEGFEVCHGNTTLIVREKECWALKIEEFDERGTPKRRATDR